MDLAGLLWGLNENSICAGGYRYDRGEGSKEDAPPLPYTSRGTSSTHRRPALRPCAGALRKHPVGPPPGSAAAQSSGFAAALLDGSGVRPPARRCWGNGERVGQRKVRLRGPGAGGVPGR